MKVMVVGHSYALEMFRPKLQCLSDLGIRLQTLVPSNWQPSKGMFKGNLFEVKDSEGPDFRLRARPVWRPGHVASHLYSFRTIWDLIADFGPNLIHVENEAYSFLAAQFVAAARLRGIRTTLFVWENVDWRVHPTQAFCRRLALSYTNGIVCGSTGAKQLIARWGFKGPTAVIPQLGVDPEVYTPPGSIDRPRPLTIGFAGRLIPEKGCDLILRAVHKLGNSGVAVRCTICGDGPASADLLQIAGELGISDRVCFLKGVPPEEMPRLLQQLDVFVLASRTTPAWAEQFGHVLIEAMSCGCIVVGARSGAIPEVIGRPDLVFEENNADDLARILGGLAGNADGQPALREFFRTRVTQNYTHEAIAVSLAGFWERVLSNDGVHVPSEKVPEDDLATIP